MNDIPPPRRRLSAERRARILAEIETRMDGYSRPRPRRHVRRLRIGVVIGLVGATAVGAAAWGLLAPQSARVHQAWCYSQPDLDSQRTSVQVQDDSGSTDGAHLALESCKATWSVGLLSHPATPGDGKTYPVPPLVECLRSDGIFAVFPSGEPGTSPTLITRSDQTDFCSRLALGVGPILPTDTP